MGSRWYNPATGGFTSRDTTANSPDPNSVAANPFAYAGDSPLVNIDPTGDSWFSSLVHKVSSTLKRAASKVKSVVKKVAAAVARSPIGRAVKTVVTVVVDVAKTEMTRYAPRCGSWRRR